MQSKVRWKGWLLSPALCALLLGIVCTPILAFQVVTLAGRHFVYPPGDN